MSCRNKVSEKSDAYGRRDLKMNEDVQYYPSVSAIKNRTI